MGARPLLGFSLIALLACHAGAAPSESSGAASSPNRNAPLPGTPLRAEALPSEAVPSAAAPDARFDDATIDWDSGPVLRTLGKITASLTWTEYSAGLSVNEKQGVYKFDCSGMVHWVLRRATPQAARYTSVGLEQRPLARDFQRRIARIAPGERKGGWLRVGRVSELHPGDVVAWLKPDVIRSPNTGHVAFVLLPPLPLPGYSNAYLVRIADSSRLLHDEDTRTDHDGFGFGTILLVVDEATGAPTAYGWVADKWTTFETQIALGRPEL